MENKNEQAGVKRYRLNPKNPYMEYMYYEPGKDYEYSDDSPIANVKSVAELKRLAPEDWEEVGETCTKCGNKTASPEPKSLSVEEYSSLVDNIEWEFMDFMAHKDANETAIKIATKWAKDNDITLPE